MAAQTRKWGSFSTILDVDLQNVCKHITAKLNIQWPEVQAVVTQSEEKSCLKRWGQGNNSCQSSSNIGIICCLLVQHTIQIEMFGNLQMVYCSILSPQCSALHKAQEKPPSCRMDTGHCKPGMAALWHLWHSLQQGKTHSVLCFSFLYNQDAPLGGGCTGCVMFFCMHSPPYLWFPWPWPGYWVKSLNKHNNYHVLHENMHILLYS